MNRYLVAQDLVGGLGRGQRHARHGRRLLETFSSLQHGVLRLQDLFLLGDASQEMLDAISGVLALVAKIFLIGIEVLQEPLSRLRREITLFTDILSNIV